MWLFFASLCYQRIFLGSPANAGLPHSYLLLATPQFITMATATPVMKPHPALLLQQQPPPFTSMRISPLLVCYISAMLAPPT